MDNCLICYRPLYEYIKVETENGEEERRLKINHRACWNSSTMLLEKQIFQTEQKLLKLRQKLANSLCKIVVMELQENNL
jgi:Zn-finger protein